MKTTLVPTERDYSLTSLRPKNFWNVCVTSFPRNSRSSWSFIFLRDIAFAKLLRKQVRLLRVYEVTIIEVWNAYAPSSFPRRILGRKKQYGVAESVNCQFHDEFDVLCSLYPDEISEEEWALLQIHMANCDSCHERLFQYQTIISAVIPVMAAVATSEVGNGNEELAASLNAAKERLMHQLDSLPTPTVQSEPRCISQRPPRLLIAVCVPVIVSLIGISFLRARFHSAAQGSETRFIHQSPVRPASATSDASDRQALQRSQLEIDNLKQQLNASEVRIAQAGLAQDRAEKQLEVEQTGRTQLEQEKERLSQQLSAAQVEMDSFRNNPTSASADGAEQANQIVALESTVRELKADLDEKDVALSETDRMLDLDKDFLAHDRDIRDLIGARNLYIADVFDTTEGGKTARHFGRIFYTKDRSHSTDTTSTARQVISRTCPSRSGGVAATSPAPVSLACSIRTIHTSGGCYGATTPIHWHGWIWSSSR